MEIGVERVGVEHIGNDNDIGIGVRVEVLLELELGWSWGWSRRSRCCESHAFARPFTDLIENFSAVKSF